MLYLKNNYKNLIVLLTGLTVLSLGSTFIIIAAMGSDSITVFSQGLASIFKIEYGYAYTLANISFFIFMIIFNRKKIGVGTIASAILIGLLINLFLKLFSFVSFSNETYSFLFSLIGLVIVAIGIALYMYSNTGLSSFEAFVDYFSSKLKIKFGYVKIVFDAILFALGVLLGGLFGITSVVSVIVLGPLIDLFGYLLNKTNLIKTNENPS